MKRCPYCHRAIPAQETVKIWLEKFGTGEKPHYKRKCNECGEPFGEHYGTECPQKIEIVDYKCTKCGLEIIILKQISHKLPKAECQNCGTKTMENNEAEAA